MNRKLAPILSVLALLMSMFVVGIAPVAAAPADSVSYTLEGCNLDHGGTFTQATITCSDNAYTTGNLGKAWEELDLVPLRITLDAAANAPSTQTYSFIVAGDFKNGAGTATGWDAIDSTPTLNTSLSDAACNPISFGTQTVTPSGAGVGGADQTIYKVATVTQQAGTFCVYDYWMRLSLGAHLFSGSSLQANLWNEQLTSGGIGQKRIQLPVGELTPPSLSKTMTASATQDNIWTLQKSASPTSLNFGNVCAPTFDNTLPVAVTVQWVKTPGTAGAITVITDIYATNVAHRDLTVTVTDVLKSGTTTIDTDVLAPVVVPAQTQNFLIAHTTEVVPAGTTNLNDSATATITDTLTGIAVPGTIGPATASATPTVTGINQTANITDSESITGNGLTFSVAAPSVGAFTGGYVADTGTVGPVGWASGVQNSSGSVTFNKTVTLTGLIVTSGVLTDTANLVASDGATAQAGPLNINIVSGATSSLTINKTIPNVLTGNETVTFTFDVTDNGALVASPSITFVAGETSKSTTVTPLTFGNAIVVTENPVTGWQNQPSQNVPSIGCSASLTFTNDFTRANAQVRKVTVPAGGESDWDMTLTGPGGPETVTTTGADYVAFTTVLQEGSYTITETQKAGYSQTGASTECSFTVDYPADAGRTFSCTFTNARPDARIRLSPLTDTNPVGGAHTITATVEQNDQLPAGAPGGDAVTGYGPAPDGTLVTFSLTNSNGATAAFVPVGGNTCTTTAGTCSVVINSPTAGSVSIHATTTFNVLGVALTRATGTTGNGNDVTKVYVDAGISVNPLTATNRVTEPHTVTATVRQNDGLPAGAPGGDAVSGFGPAPDGTTVQFSLLSNTAGASFVGPSSCLTAGGTGQCSVDINTTTPGSVLIHVESTFSVGGVTLTRASDGAGNNSVDGGKVFVNARINLTPLTATNPVRSPHTVTATVQQDDGLAANAPGGDAVTGYGPAPDGTLVTFSLLNNTANADFVPVGANTCLTAGGTGQCSIVINASTAGSVDIHATTTFSVGGLSLTRATGSPGNSTDANKVYVSGTIIVRKVTNPAGGTGFDFVGTGGIPAAFSLDDGQSVTYSELVPGAYSVRETNKVGWAFTSLVCTATGTGTSRTIVGPLATITLAGGGVVDCTYTNTQLARVSLFKTVGGQPIPAGLSILFQVRTGASVSSQGSIQATATVNSTTVFPLNLFGPDAFVAPGDYQICEFILPGWDSTIRHLPGAFVPESASDPANFDNGYVCAPISLLPGSVTTLNVDNVPPPGGAAKTIGFWKNHASCKTSNGKQEPILDQTLALAPIVAGQTTRGFFIGDEYIDTCNEARLLLDKSDLSGKKQASLPEFNFASQATAYQLNLIAGAGNTAAATAAFAAGQAILDENGFIGNALPKNGANALTAAEKTALNTYAGILDDYNNNV